MENVKKCTKYKKTQDSVHSVYEIQIYLSAVYWCIVFSCKSISSSVAVLLISLRYLSRHCVNNVYKNQRTNGPSVFLGLVIMFIPIKGRLIYLYLKMYDNVKKSVVSLSRCK